MERRPRSRHRRGLAEQGYKVAVGKFLAAAGRWHRWRRSASGRRIQHGLDQVPWEKQPKVEAALGFLKAEGCTKIGVMGFCSRPPGVLGVDHDRASSAAWSAISMQLEGFAFGGDTVALLKSVQCRSSWRPQGATCRWSTRATLARRSRRAPRAPVRLVHVPRHEPRLVVPRRPVRREGEARRGGGDEEDAIGFSQSMCWRSTWSGSGTVVGSRADRRSESAV